MIVPLDQWKQWLPKLRICKLKPDQEISLEANYSGKMIHTLRLSEAGIGLLKKENVEKYVLETLALHNYLSQTDNAGYCPSVFVDSEDSTGHT